MLPRGALLVQSGSWAAFLCIFVPFHRLSICPIRKTEKHPRDLACIDSNLFIACLIVSIMPHQTRHPIVTVEKSDLRLKLHVRLQSLHLVFREIFEQLQLVKTLQVAMQTPKIYNGPCLIKTDVGMFFQFVEG